jgi:TRAP transporter TAXI family solute receptor
MGDFRIYYGELPMRFTKYAILAMIALVSGSLAQAQDRADWPNALSIATAGAGGVYHVYGEGLAALITNDMGVPTRAEATGGTGHNATLIEMALNDIGLVTMGPMLEALRGEGELAYGVPHDNVRALFPMYETVFQGIALHEAEITSLADLQGKRISVGPSGGTPGTYWPRILEALDIKAEVTNTTAVEAAEQLKAGTLDAFLFAGGLPVSTFSSLAAELGARPFSVSGQEQEKILSEFAEFAHAMVPANIYVTQEGNQVTFGMWNFAIVHAKMPESLAYEITKLVMENNPRIRQIHAAGKDTLPQNHVHNTFLKFHPGAVRWFTENGFTISAHLTH